MAKLTISRGSTANDGTGDNLREGANKVNLNFDEIYTAIGNGSTVDGTIKIADDSSTVATISANGETLKVLGGTSVSLGATAATVTNLALTGTSGISGTGAIDTTSSGNKLRFNFANTGSLPTAATYEGMFAYDIGGNNPYVADAGGWVKLLTDLIIHLQILQTVHYQILRLHLQETQVVQRLI